jgi:hypothetical protein
VGTLDEARQKQAQQTAAPVSDAQKPDKPAQAAR